MRRGGKLAVVALSTIAIGASLFELDRRTHADRPAPAAHYLSGEVERVEVSDALIVLRIGMGAKLEEATIATPADARIVYRKHPIALGEVKVGDHATVRLKGSERVAELVRIARPARAAR